MYTIFIQDCKRDKIPMYIMYLMEYSFRFNIN